MTVARVEVEDTYAEAFRSYYAEVLITARDHRWLAHACQAVCGHASSSIFCDCEAGVDRVIDPTDDGADSTPDGRPGAVVQFHVPRFWKDAPARLERALLHRISQNVLTCPTAACFSRLDTADYFKLGRKLAFFGDGYQFRAVRYQRRVWVVPIMGGEFVVDRRFGYREGIMGGNLWFFGTSADAALEAAERGVAAATEVPGVILPFPGGVAGSGSKAGSRYPFLFASTNHPYCPTLRDKLGEASRVPPEVVSIQEIIVNGCDLPTVSRAVQAAIRAAVDTPGLVKISAGNYGGRLGKSWVWLKPELHPPAAC